MDIQALKQAAEVFDEQAEHVDLGLACRAPNVVGATKELLRLALDLNAPAIVALLEAETERRKSAEKERDEWKHAATHGAYFIAALYNMLGEKGRQVADGWRKRRVQRVHYKWGPKATNMTGEERAQTILDVEAELSREMKPGESNGDMIPRTKRKSMNLREFLESLGEPDAARAHQQRHGDGDA